MFKISFGNIIITPSLRGVLAMWQSPILSYSPQSLASALPFGALGTFVKNSTPVNRSNSFIEIISPADGLRPFAER